MNNLLAIESFITVVESGSITAAAEKLSLTPAAVSKRLQLLERYLGTRLLTRNTRQMALTAAGDYYFHHNRSLLSEMERIDKHVQDMQGVLKGNLDINLPMTYGKNRLAPLLAQFLLQHPDIHLDTCLDDSMIDVSRGNYDLVVRIGELEDSALIARKLEDISLYLLAAPAYLDRHGYPQTPDDLARHNCLQYTNTDQRDGWRFYHRDGAQHRVRTRGSLSSNNGEALKVAVLEGLGIALLPDFTLEGEIAAGTLVRLLPDFNAYPVSAYAVYPSRRYLPEKTRALINFLVASLNSDDLH